VLADADLALPNPAAAFAAATAAVPLLWPLGMFAAPGSKLHMADVRVVLRSDGDFQQALRFFQGLPSAAATFWTVRAVQQQLLQLRLSGSCTQLALARPVMMVLTL
jgi:hypothetical protein